MRVLTASQADGVALEIHQVRQGLLSYALAHDGLELQRAVGPESRLTLRRLLAFAADRVPGLYIEIINGQVSDGKNAQARNVTPILSKNSAVRWVQKPEFFDYARKRPDISLGVRSQPRP
jgi:hypothetical protein